MKTTWLLVIAGLAIASSACDGGDDSDGDGDVDADGDVDGDGDVDADGDGDVDADGDADAGGDSGGDASCRPEECNGEDDDCDGVLDNGFDCAFGATVDCTSSCGTAGLRYCEAGCLWSSFCTPPEEECNDEDDDCDGTIDNGFECRSGEETSCTTSCGSTGTGICNACAPPAPEACEPPVEVCGNDEDDDCDGVIDPPAGTGIGDLRELSDAVMGFSDVSALWNGLEYAIAWASRAGYSWDIYFARLDDDGALIGDATRVTNTESCLNPTLVWNGTGYGLAFRCGHNAESEIYFTTLGADGSPSGSVLRLTNDDEFSTNPKLAWHGDGFGLFWLAGVSPPTAAGQLMFARISPAGALVAPPVAVVDSPQLVWNVEPIWIGTVYGVAWRGAAALGEDKDVLFATLASDGSVIDGPVNISMVGGAGTPLALQWTGEEFALAWVVERSDGDAIQVTPLDTTGTIVRGASLVTLDPGSVWRLGLQWTGDGYGCSWVSDYYIDSDLLFTRLDATGAPEGTPVQVTDDSRPAEELDLTWTGSQHWLAYIDRAAEVEMDLPIDLGLARLSDCH